MLRVYVCPYNTTQPLRFSSARDCSFLTSVCVWLAVLFQPCTVDPSTPATMASQKAGLILSRVSASLGNAHRPKRQNPGLGPGKARIKKGRPKSAPKKGGHRSSKAFLFFFCYPGFLLASLGVKIGPIARLPGKGGLKGRRCLHCLNVDGLNFLEIPQAFFLHVG